MVMFHISLDRVSRDALLNSMDMDHGFRLFETLKIPLARQEKGLTHHRCNTMLPTAVITNCGIRPSNSCSPVWFLDSLLDFCDLGH